MVRVVITFTKFIELQPIEHFYTPLSSPRQLGVRVDNEEESTSKENSFTSFSSSWLSSSKRRSSKQSCNDGEQLDPFAIPSGYRWSSFDEKNKKMKKTKLTTRKKN